MTLMFNLEGRDLLIAASQGTTLYQVIKNPYQLTAIQILLQLDGRDPIVMVKGIQIIGGERFMNNQDRGIDSQS